MCGGGEGGDKWLIGSTREVSPSHHPCNGMTHNGNTKIGMEYIILQMTLAASDAPYGLPGLAALPGRLLLGGACGPVAWRSPRAVRLTGLYRAGSHTAVSMPSGTMRILAGSTPASGQQQASRCVHMLGVIAQRNNQCMCHNTEQQAVHGRSHCFKLFCFVCLVRLLWSYL